MANSNVFGRSESLALNSRTFARFADAKPVEAMTVRGAVNKTAVLLVIVMASAGCSWFLIGHNTGRSAWLLAAMLGALVAGLITTFNMHIAPIMTPLYALLEGIVLGGVSAVFEASYPGIVAQAVVLTFGTLFSLLIVYRASGFQVTKRFRAGLIAATGGIVLVYLANLALWLLGLDSFPFMGEGGLIGIGFSLFVVVIAALNLVLDFDLIESGARQGAPKYMEWYAAYGLMVTLIWLYWEVLKFFIQLAASSDDN